MNAHTTQALVLSGGFILDLANPVRFDDMIFSPITDSLWLAVYEVRE